MSWYGTLYDDTIGKILPSKPPDPNKSPAGVATTDFATGLGDQRSGFTPTSAPRVVEGSAPQPTGNLTDVKSAGRSVWGGARHAPATDTQTQYADPNGLNNQNFALGLDKDAAEGKTPSAAENLYRKGTDEGMASQLALAATTQGENPGMSQRAGLNGAQQVALNNSAGAGALRAQEMATARGAYGDLATQTRGQTLQGAEANQAANLQQQQANNAFYLGLTDEQQKALQALMGGAEANAQNQQKYGAANQQFFGGLASGSGSSAASAAGPAAAA
jgi:hypothetical protein